jgi:hypothetical protein
MFGVDRLYLIFLQTEDRFVYQCLHVESAIVTKAVARQLDLFLPFWWGSRQFALNKWLSGSGDNFSIDAAQKALDRVLPTIVLISGTLEYSENNEVDEKTGSWEKILLGAYLPKYEAKPYLPSFTPEDGLLFQLTPVHTVYRTSTKGKDWAPIDVSFSSSSISIAIHGVRSNSSLPFEESMKLVIDQTNPQTCCYITDVKVREHETKSESILFPRNTIRLEQIEIWNVMM